MTAYQIRRETRENIETLFLEGPGGIPRLSLIPFLGAYVYSWIAESPASGQPVELIWPGNFDEAVRLNQARTLAGFPFLFPFANRVFQDGKEGAWQWQGKRYPMTIHGFSNNVPWSVAATQAGADSATVTLALEESPYTLEMYPWPFRVELTYTLSTNQLTIDHRIENRGDSPMPLSPGWHPYFLVPMSPEGTKSDCVLEVPGKTRLGINVQNCNMTGERFPFDQQTMTLAEHGPTGMYITDLTEPRVALRDPAAALGVEMDLRDAAGRLAWPYILTWTLSDDARFFCIEPYEGVTDTVHNGIGLRILAPKASYTTRLTTRTLQG
jgi:galactose mutarotase-like enzyme